MGLDKAIEHGKEKRKPFNDWRQYDSWCRNHGGCHWCESNRMHGQKMRLAAANDKMKEAEETDEYQNPEQNKSG